MGIFDRIAGTLDDLVAGDDAQSETRAKDELTLARAFIERGDLDEAAARIDDVAGRHPRLAAVFVARGELAVRRRDDDGAATAFGRAVDLEATDAEAWLRLGQTLARLQRFEPARDALRRALAQALAPEQRALAQATLGRLYARAGQRGKAIRELRKAAEVLPDDGEVLVALGRALVMSGETEGADWLARAARLPGGEARLLIEAADAKSSRAERLRLLDEAVERTPDDAVVRTARAHYFLAQGDPAAALAEAVTATEQAPRWAGAWRTLGEVRAATGDFAEAIACVRREAELDAPPPFSIWLAYALGAGDRDAVSEALGHGEPRAPGFAEAHALAAGTLDRAALLTLAELAPSAAARRFVVRSLAPPSVPAGNILALLAWAEALSEHQPILTSLAVPMARAVEAFDRPLLVAVMGEFNAGKSSLVNALAGDAIAPVGVTPTTATINVLRFGPRGGRVSYHDGTTRDLGPESVGPFLAGLGDTEAATVRQVEVFAPLEALRRVEIVDTPGLNSLRPEHEKVARDFLVDADALVWVFAAGQAAKATEREALRLAHAAGKRVLGVINKIDRVEPDELTAILRHVATTLGDLVEDVIPLSAQAALAARQPGSVAPQSPASSSSGAAGLDALEARLDRTFFAHARELKRGTAVAALRRFLTEAQALITGTERSSIPPDGARQALSDARQRLQSALAAERVTLRARLNEGFRLAASEVREFIRPRGWLFGEHRADPADEAFLADILDDATIRATAATRAALVTAIATSDGAAVPRAAELSDAIDDAIERFRAYARGITEGAATVFFRVDLPRIRLDLGAIHAVLARWLPEPEEYLFRTIERAALAITQRAEKDLDREARSREIAELMRNEHLVQPLHALAGAVDALTVGSGTDQA